MEEQKWARMETGAGELTGPELADGNEGWVQLMAMINEVQETAQHTSITLQEDANRRRPPHLLRLRDTIRCSRRPAP